MKRVGLVALLGMLVFACGARGPREILPERMPTPPKPEVLVPGVQVAPDRADIGVTLVFRSPQAGDARTGLHTLMGDLDRSLATVSGCRFAPSGAGELSANNLVTSATAHGAVLVDLKGAGTTMQRIQRIESCMTVVRQWTGVYDVSTPLGLEGQRFVGEGAITPQVSDPIAHLPVLLADQERRLAMVHDVSVPTWHPEELRCVPTGTVEVGEARLSGVTLTLGLQCKVVTPTEDA